MRLLKELLKQQLIQGGTVTILEEDWTLSLQSEVEVTLKMVGKTEKHVRSL